MNTHARSACVCYAIFARLHATALLRFALLRLRSCGLFGWTRFCTICVTFRSLLHYYVWFAVLPVTHHIACYVYRSFILRCHGYAVVGSHGYATTRCRSNVLRTTLPGCVPRSVAFSPLPRLRGTVPHAVTFSSAVGYRAHRCTRVYYRFSLHTRLRFTLRVYARFAHFTLRYAHAVWFTRHAVLLPNTTLVRYGYIYRVLHATFTHGWLLWFATLLVGLVPGLPAVAVPCLPRFTGLLHAVGLYRALVTPCVLRLLRLHHAFYALLPRLVLPPAFAVRARVPRVPGCSCGLLVLYGLHTWLDALQFGYRSRLRCRSHWIHHYTHRYTTFTVLVATFCARCYTHIYAVRSGWLRYSHSCYSLPPAVPVTPHTRTTTVLPFVTLRSFGLPRFLRSAVGSVHCARTFVRSGSTIGYARLILFADTVHAFYLPVRYTGYAHSCYTRLPDTAFYRTGSTLPLRTHTFYTRHTAVPFAVAVPFRIRCHIHVHLLCHCLPHRGSHVHTRTTFTAVRTFVHVLYLWLLPHGCGWFFTWFWFTVPRLFCVAHFVRHVCRHTATVTVHYTHAVMRLPRAAFAHATRAARSVTLAVCYIPLPRAHTARCLLRVTHCPFAAPSRFLVGSFPVTTFGCTLFTLLVTPHACLRTTAVAAHGLDCLRLRYTLYRTLDYPFAVLVYHAHTVFVLRILLRFTPTFAVYLAVHYLPLPGYRLRLPVRTHCRLPIPVTTPTFTTVCTLYRLRLVTRCGCWFSTFCRLLPGLPPHLVVTPRFHTVPVTFAVLFTAHTFTFTVTHCRFTAAAWFLPVPFIPPGYTVVVVGCYTVYYYIRFCGLPRIRFAALHLQFATPRGYVYTPLVTVCHGLHTRFTVTHSCLPAVGLPPVTLHSSTFTFPAVTRFAALLRGYIPLPRLVTTTHTAVDCHTHTLPVTHWVHRARTATRLRLPVTTHTLHIPLRLRLPRLPVTGLPCICVVTRAVTTHVYIYRTVYYLRVHILPFVRGLRLRVTVAVPPLPTTARCGSGSVPHAVGFLHRCVYAHTFVARLPTLPNALVTPFTVTYLVGHSAFGYALRALPYLPLRSRLVRCYYAFTFWFCTPHGSAVVPPAAHCYVHCHFTTARYTRFWFPPVHTCCHCSACRVGYSWFTGCLYGYYLRYTVGSNAPTTCGYYVYVVYRLPRSTVTYITTAYHALPLPHYHYRRYPHRIRSAYHGYLFLHRYGWFDRLRCVHPVYVYPLPFTRFCCLRLFTRFVRLHLVARIAAIAAYYRLVTGSHHVTHLRLRFVYMPCIWLLQFLPVARFAVGLPVLPVLTVVTRCRFAALRLPILRLRYGCRSSLVTTAHYPVPYVPRLPLASVVLPDY